MVMVDHGLIKGVILILCLKTIAAAGVIKHFFENVFKQFGLHDTLISNRGPQFTSAFAREQACLLQYDVCLSTAYHSQTDSQTECINQEIEIYLWIFCTNWPHGWTKFLPTAEFQHNSSSHSSTKVLPFLLLHGYKPQAYPPIGKTFFPTLETCLTIMDKARKEALAVQKTAWWIMQEHVTGNFTPWKVKDKVWLKATNLHLHYPSWKLAPKWHCGSLQDCRSIITPHLLPPTTVYIENPWCFPTFLLLTYWETLTHGPNFLKWSFPIETHWLLPITYHMEELSLVREHLET